MPKQNQQMHQNKLKDLRSDWDLRLETIVHPLFSSVDEHFEIQIHR